MAIRETVAVFDESKFPLWKKNLIKSEPSTNYKTVIPITIYVIVHIILRILAFISIMLTFEATLLVMDVSRTDPTEVTITELTMSLLTTCP